MQSQKRKQRRGTHVVSLQTAQQLDGKFGLIPGEKPCRECWIHTKNILDGPMSLTPSTLSETTAESSESSSVETYPLLDDALAACGVSSFKNYRKVETSKPFSCKQKNRKSYQKL